MLNNEAVYKYENQYNMPFEIRQCWANGVVTLQMVAIKIRYNIH